MEWINQFGADTQPSAAEIDAFISNPLWARMNRFLRDGYHAEPNYRYSACSGQPGWNVKYQKAGRSLCTLYPMRGHFIALIVIGAKEESEAELMLPTLSAYTQSLFDGSVSAMGGRWLMMAITDEQILSDAMRLIQLRRKIQAK